MIDLGNVLLILMINTLKRYIRRALFIVSVIGLPRDCFNSKIAKLNISKYIKFKEKFCTKFISVKKAWSQFLLLYYIYID